MSKEREAFDSWYGKKPKAWLEGVKYNTAWKAWQAAKAQAVPEGFMVVPNEPTKDTLIEIASVCIGDDFANLDEAKDLYKAAIEAQQPSSTSDCPDEP